MAHHFDGLEIGERIGQGGEGVVYKARQLAIDRMVAVKMQRSSKLEGSMDSDDTGVSLGIDPQFDNEMTFAGRIHHESIVPVYHGQQISSEPDSGELMIAKLIVDENGNTCTAQEFIDDRLNNSNLDDPTAFYNATANQFLGIIRGVQATHLEGIIHRDIKPKNILVGEQQKLYLTDFGLAVNEGTQSNTVGGSPYFVAPEQLAGRPQKQSDIFSLGLTLAVYLGSAFPKPWIDAYVRINAKNEDSDSNTLEDRSLSPELISKSFVEATRRRTAVVGGKVENPEDLCSLPQDGFLASEFCPNAPRFLRYIVDNATRQKLTERTQTAFELEQQLVDYLDGLPSPDDPIRLLKLAKIWIRNNIPLLVGLLMLTGIAVLMWWNWSTRQSQLYENFSQSNRRFEEGSSLLSQGFNEQAQNQFSRAIAQYPAQVPAAWKIKLARSKIGYVATDEIHKELRAISALEIDKESPEYAELNLLMADLEYCMSDGSSEKVDLDSRVKSALSGNLSAPDAHYARALLAKTLDQCKQHLADARAISPNHDRACALHAAILFMEGQTRSTVDFCVQQELLRPKNSTNEVVLNSARFLMSEGSTDQVNYTWLKAHTSRNFHNALHRLFIRPSLISFVSPDLFWTEVLSLSKQVPRARAAESMILQLTKANSSIAIPKHIAEMRANSWAELRKLLQQAVDSNLDPDVLTKLEAMGADDPDAYCLLTSTLNVAKQMCVLLGKSDAKSDDVLPIYERFLSIQQSAKDKQSLFFVDQILLVNNAVTRACEFDYLFRMNHKGPAIEKRLRNELCSFFNKAETVKGTNRDRLIRLLLDGAMRLYKDCDNRGTKNRIARLALIPADDWAIASPNAETFFYQAGFLHYCGENDKALERVNQSLDIDSSYSRSLRLRTKLMNLRSSQSDQTADQT